MAEHTSFNGEEARSTSTPLGSRNPFHYLRPVHPSEFLGRWPLVEEVATDLTLDQGESHACIAGRRLGKSSFLAALYHCLLHSNVRTGDHSILPIMLSFKKYNFSNEVDFFTTVLQEIVRQLERACATGTNSPIPAAVGTELDSEWLQKELMHGPVGLPLVKFEDIICRLLSVLYQTGGPTRLVILLDEVDDALRYSWIHVLFGQIRSIIYEGVIADSVRIVLAGSRRTFDEITSQGSPLWNILKVHYLSVFDEATTYKLMQRVPDLRLTAQEAVWLQSGGHPFLAQYLLHHLWRSDINQADESTVARVAERFLHEEQVHFEGWAKAVQTTGMFVYGHFANREDWIDELELVETTLGLRIPLKRTLTELCYHGLLTHDGQWQRYRRTSLLFRNWYTQEGKLHASLQNRADVQNVASSTRAANREDILTPIRILFLAANPVDTERLRLDEEVRTIDERLRTAEFRERFDLVQHWALRHTDLAEYLLRHRPHILHISGHGSNQGSIVLEDRNGNAKPVTPQALANLLRILKDNLRCVVLNACYSAVQAQAIVEEAGCVLSMSESIGDEAAVQFASGFYRGIGFGRSVQTAFDLGCSEIDLAGLSEEDTPKLLVKAGVDAATLILSRSEWF